ncbi:MAG: glycosyltransferase family 4 protein [bacterium]|nr:glycosyltransferase family 4 protein [bacterium]
MTQLKTLADALIARGHRVVYIVQGNTSLTDSAHFKVYRFPSPRPTRPRDFIFLHRLVRQYRPDCMIGNFATVNVMTLTGWLNGVPNRVNWYRTLSAAIDHDAAPKPRHPLLARLLHLRKKGVYALSTNLVANSKAAYEDMLHVYQIPCRKARLIYNAIPDVGMSLGITPLPAAQRKGIIAIGRLEMTKGQDILLRALKILRDRGLTPQVSFLGQGSQAAAWKALAEQLGVQDQCRFLGYVAYQDVFQHMAQAALCISPSRSDAFGWVNIEAMSMFTPVIASAVGGVPEVICDGIDGFLVPSENPEALADTIQRVLPDVRLRAQIGQQARRRFLSTFEQTRNIEQQVLWFESLIDRAGSSPVQPPSIMHRLR